MMFVSVKTGMRWLVIVGCVILLLDAMIYGPGRGVTLIPDDMEWDGFLQYMRITAYCCILAGAILWKRQALSLGLLVAGVIARMVVESRISLLRECYAHFEGVTRGMWVWVAVFYLISFVLPALCCLDCFREGRR